MLYQLHKFSNNMHYLLLEEKLVKKLTIGGNKRIICTLNEKISFHAAILQTKTGEHYIYAGSQYLKKLKLKAGDMVNASFKKDTTALQFHIPEEFREVMDTDEAARKIFDSLTDGNKRGLVALVNMVKSSDKKIERALRISLKLKRGITSPALVMKRDD